MGSVTPAVNGVYTPSGTSDSVPKYSNGTFVLLRCQMSGDSCYWCLVECEEAVRAPSAARSNKCYYFCRSRGATPPLGVQWERGNHGTLPSMVVFNASDSTSPPPTSVAAASDVYEVGDYIEANWCGRGVFFPGEILVINEDDNSFDILYDDGDYEAHVPREHLRPVRIELSDAFHTFAVGDVVEADLRGHGTWYSGRIVAVDLAFRVFTIKYDNQHLEKHVRPSRVRPIKHRQLKLDYTSGERVRANWRGCGMWCLGRICAVHRNEGTFDVIYDDGQMEADVTAHRLQAAEVHAEPKTQNAQSPPESGSFACSLGVSKTSAACAHHVHSAGPHISCGAHE
mgnify:CR=1 FL=1